MARLFLQVINFFITPTHQWQLFTPAGSNWSSAEQNGLSSPQTGKLLHSAEHSAKHLKLDLCILIVAAEDQTQVSDLKDNWAANYFFCLKQKVSGIVLYTEQRIQDK